VGNFSTQAAESSHRVDQLMMSSPGATSIACFKIGGLFYVFKKLMDGTGVA
jgi:hypothetical protein